MKTEKRLFSFRQIQSMCRDRRMAWGYEDYCFTIPHTRKTKCESKNCPKWKRATRVSREPTEKVSTTQTGWEAMKKHKRTGGLDARCYKDGDHLIAVVEGEGGRRMTVEERDGELWAVPVLREGLEDQLLQEWIDMTFRGVKYDEKEGRNKVKIMLDK